MVLPYLLFFVHHYTRLDRFVSYIIPSAFVSGSRLRFGPCTTTNLTLFPYFHLRVQLVCAYDNVSILPKPVALALVPALPVHSLFLCDTSYSLFAVRSLQYGCIVPFNFCCLRAV